MGGSEQRPGSGPTEPDTVCVGGEDRGAGGSSGPGSAGGQKHKWDQRPTSAPWTTSLLESLLLPGHGTYSPLNSFEFSTFEMHDL